MFWFYYKLGNQKSTLAGGARYAYAWFKNLISWPVNQFVTDEKEKAIITDKINVIGMIKEKKMLLVSMPNSSP